MIAIGSEYVGLGLSKSSYYRSRDTLFLFLGAWCSGPTTTTSVLAFHEFGICMFGHLDSQGSSREQVLKALQQNK